MLKSMLDQQKKISVIIPIYNAENYLSRCLNSIVNCNYRNLEIICVNDGSPDKSIDIIKEFKERDSRLRIVDKENGGLSSARNAGLSVATGEYISFIDADDWIHPDYFNILTEFVSDYTDAAICGFKQESKYSSDFKEYDDEEIKNEIWKISSDTLFQEKKLEMFKVYSCGVLYKREKIYNLFPHGVKVIEDNIFNLLNLSLYDSVLIINLPLYFYYVNNNSIMHTYSCSDAFSGLIWLCKCLNENRELCRRQQILAVDFIYKRSFYYRYVFSCFGYAEEVKEYTTDIYKSLREYDCCLSLIKKCIFRLFKSVPACYSIMKFLKGDHIKRDVVFSAAPGKLINPSDKQRILRKQKNKIFNYGNEILGEENA